MVPGIVLLIYESLPIAASSCSQQLLDVRFVIILTHLHYVNYKNLPTATNKTKDEKIPAVKTEGGRQKTDYLYDIL